MAGILIIEDEAILAIELRRYARSRPRVLPTGIIGDDARLLP